MEDLQNKDKTIRHIYQEIINKFGIESFTISDWFEADNFAIGLIQKNKLIYISTWECFNNNIEDSYFVDLEILDFKDLEKEKVIKNFESINKLELLIEIKKFLNF